MDKGIEGASGPHYPDFGDLQPDHPPRTDISGRIEQFFVRHRRKLVWVHATFFVVFMAILFVPLFLPNPPEAATVLDNFTLMSNFIMWGLWFPLVFLSVLATGRSWCGIACPMGAASEWANNAGKKQAIPAWIRWDGTPIVSFMIVTILGQTVGVRDHPEAIAQVFGGTMLAAAVVGFLWGKRRRAWCRHMCPIGLLLGVFSRLGAVEFRSKQPPKGDDRWVETGPCPTMIDIHRKSESRHCIECFRCVTPGSNQGLRLDFRVPGSEVENIRDHHASLTEVWFLFIATGTAIGGFFWLVLPIYQRMRQALGEWFIDRGMYWIGESGPSWLMSVHPDRREVFVWLDFIGIVGFMLGFALLFALVLAGLTAATAWLSGKMGGDGAFRQRFTELGYLYAPVAMVSLIIGLGAKLFEGLKLFGLTTAQVGDVKAGLFLLALAWSLWLAYRILARQGVPGLRRALPMAVGAIGALTVGYAWWTAIFGV